MTSRFFLNVPVRSLVGLLLCPSGFAFAVANESQIKGFSIRLLSINQSSFVFYQNDLSSTKKIINHFSMTALERKQQTETFLSQLGIPVYSELPAIEEESAVQIRSVQEITARIMILAYLNCIAIQEDLQPEILEYLKTQGLWEKVSVNEKIYFEKDSLTEEEKDIIASRAESIWLLLWAINKVDRLPLPTKEVDVDILFPLLPPFMEDPTEYITTASIRSASEILNEADFIFRLNWALSKTSLEGLHARVAFERYVAVNWITSARKDWDDHAI